MSTCSNRRLLQEYAALCRRKTEGPTSAMGHFLVHPVPDSLEWHYVITRLPDDTPYAGGCYYGSITFPANYPLSPPSIKMFTPNGRFATDRRLCLSMSDYHPESWNPHWTVETIILGLMSFMLDDGSASGTMSTSVEARRIMAQESFAWNCSQPQFVDFFEEELRESTVSLSAPREGGGVQDGAQTREEWHSVPELASETTSESETQHTTLEIGSVVPADATVDQALPLATPLIGLRDTVEEEESEDRLCWLCMDADRAEPLVSPCACRGTIRFVHASCIETWLNERLRQPLAETRCGLCGQQYSVVTRPSSLCHLLGVHLAACPGWSWRFAAVFLGTVMVESLFFFMMLGPVVVILIATLNPGSLVLFSVLSVLCYNTVVVIMTLIFCASFPRGPPPRNRVLRLFHVRRTLHPNVHRCDLGNLFALCLPGLLQLIRLSLNIAFLVTVPFVCIPFMDNVKFCFLGTAVPPIIFFWKWRLNGRAAQPPPRLLPPRRSTPRQPLSLACCRFHFFEFCKRYHPLGVRFHTVLGFNALLLHIYLGDFGLLCDPFSVVASFVLMCLGVVTSLFILVAIVIRGPMSAPWIGTNGMSRHPFWWIPILEIMCLFVIDWSVECDDVTRKIDTIDVVPLILAGVYAAILLVIFLGTNAVLLRNYIQRWRMRHGLVTLVNTQDSPA